MCFTMGFCAHKVALKLPRDIFNCERSQFNCIRGLLTSVKADRARVFLCQVPSSNFRFQRHSVSWLSAVNKWVDNVSFVSQRCYATTGQDKASSSAKKSLVQARESPYAHLTVGQRVKEVGKDVSYLGVIIVGLAVTGFIFYVIGSELFSSQSPSGVYGDALKKCQESIEVTSALGEPIKAYGETSRRGRRRHVRHTEFEVDGVPHMRVQFYIEGPNHSKATVHVEVQKDDSSGKYEYRYLVVETAQYPHRTFVLEDNRQKGLRGQQMLSI